MAHLLGVVEAAPTPGDDVGVVGQDVDVAARLRAPSPRRVTALEDRVGDFSKDEVRDPTPEKLREPPILVSQS